MRSLTLFLTNLLTLTATIGQEIKTYGVMLNVTDMTTAKEFYCGKLGFEILSEITADFIELRSGDRNKLYLHKVPLLLPEGDKEIKASFTLQVNDLDQTIERMKASGLGFGNEQKRKEGVGYAIYITNPFSKKISLMHQTVGDQTPFKEPRIYNYGFLVPDMYMGIEFYSRVLGFEERNQRYLPLDMPLGHEDGSFAFMLHYRVGVEAIRFNHPDTEHVVILFQTSDLEQSITTLSKKGVTFLQKQPESSPIGKHISFYDPFGYLSELIEVK